jgi:hypothetical protein
MTKTKTSLVLPLALLALLAGCGSSATMATTPDAAAVSDAGRNDAAADTHLVADGPAMDVAAADAPAIPDAAADLPPADIAELVPDAAEPDAAEPDAAEPDAAELPDAAPDVVAMCRRIKCDCTFKGKKLSGRFEVVNALADFRVKVVTALPDLRVEKVTALADSCGKWEEVSAIPNFTVQIVDALEDFSIEYVDAFPGLP